MSNKQMGIALVVALIILVAIFAGFAIKGGNDRQQRIDDMTEEMFNDMTR